LQVPVSDAEAQHGIRHGQERLNFVEILQGKEIGLKCYRREAGPENPLAKPPGKDPALRCDLGVFDVNLIWIDGEGKLCAGTAE
jgi:hypothetical protein